MHPKHQAEKQLQGSRGKSPYAGHVALVGNWALEIGSGQLHCSDQVFEVFGVERANFGSDYDAFLERIHPDDRARVNASVQAAQSGNTSLDMEYRTILPDGTVRHIHALGDLSRDECGSPQYLVGTVLDVTERRRAEERIRLLESAVVNAHDAVMITEGTPIDLPGPRILYVNHAFERMTGYSVEEVLGKTPRILQGPRTDRAVLNRLRTALLRREPIQVELINYRKDGAEIYVEISIVPVTDSSGELTHFTAIQRDTTERKRNEEALRASEERFRATFEQAPVGICQITLADGAFVRANSRLCEMLGYSAEELTALTFRDVTHPDDLSRSAALVNELSTGKSRFFAIDKRYVRKDGGIVWARSTVSVLQEPGGEPRYMVAIVEDVTRRKQTEQTLQFQAHLLDRIGEAVIATDPTGKIVYFNRFAETLYGWQRSEVIGRDVVQLLSPAFKAGQAEEIAKAAERGENSSGELLVKRRDGSTLPVSFTTTSLKNGEGKPTTIVGVMADITERWEAAATRAHLAAIVESSSDAIISKSLSGVITSWNSGAEKLYGYLRSEIAGSSMLHLIPPSLQPQELESLQKVAAGERVCELYSQRLSKAGRTIDVSITASPIRDDSGAIIGVAQIERDITDRKLAEEVLHELSARLIRAQDEERRRIARELHDSTAQQLVAIAMNLGIVQERVAGQGPDATAGNVLADTAALVEQCTREIRTLSHLLYPPLLDELGLFRALRDYIQRFSRSSGIAVRFEAAEQDIGRLSQEVETAVFRVVQESLANVLRHSGSPEARVRIRSLENKLELEISDRGRGLPAEVLSAQGGGGFGIGILGMRERLRQLGGIMEIINRNGVTVHVVVPRHSPSS